MLAQIGPNIISVNQKPNRQILKHNVLFDQQKAASFSLVLHFPLWFINGCVKGGKEDGRKWTDERDASKVVTTCIVFSSYFSASTWNTVQVKFCPQVCIAPPSRGGAPLHPSFPDACKLGKLETKLPIGNIGNMSKIVSCLPNVRWDCLPPLREVDNGWKNGKQLSYFCSF